jgi:hypothetical protein
MTIVIRQGDILSRRLEQLPQGDAQTRTGRVILAEGEATGHAHVLEIPEGVTVKWIEGTFVDTFRLPVAMTITHQEHDEVVLEPGDYAVAHQWECPLPGVARRVMD